MFAESYHAETNRITFYHLPANSQILPRLSNEGKGGPFLSSVNPTADDAVDFHLIDKNSITPE